MDPQPPAPAFERPILTYWWLLRPNGQTLACTSYRTAAGLELRAGVPGEPPVLHAAITTHAEAQRLAEAWKRQIMQPAAA